MNAPISLITDASLVREYRRLLTEDWTEKSLAGVLDLLAKQLPPAERGKIRKETETPLPVGFVPMPVRLAIEENTRGNGHQPGRVGARPDEQLASCVKSTVFFLLFQFAHTIEKESALFVDSQSLLFLCAIHALLPALSQKKMAGQRRSLLMALWFHCSIWESDIPHLLYLRANLFHYLGLLENETSDLAQSFKLTPPDEHDYLTKAQAVWTSMLERNELSAAKEFMLEVYRNCPQTARGEVREILDETYSLTSARAKGKRAGTG
jgi:hypothetical protein